MSYLDVSRAAENDLTDIWSYIAADNEVHADRLLAEIRGMLNQLAATPGIGRQRSELRPNLRSYPVGNYIIYYVPIKGGIKVTRVVHGRRDVGKIFRKRGR